MMEFTTSLEELMLKKMKTKRQCSTSAKPIKSHHLALTINWNLARYTTKSRSTNRLWNILKCATK